MDHRSAALVELLKKAAAPVKEPTYIPVDLNKIPAEFLVPHHIGGWLPMDQRVLEKWLDRSIEIIDIEPIVLPEQFHPVVKEFQRTIENNAEIYMGFHEMFSQVPKKPPYDRDPTGKPQVRDYMVMLRLFNRILTTAPEWEPNDLVGTPINAILDWPMGTPAGYTAFTNPIVNAQFKRYFDQWALFLCSKRSRYVLNESATGWLGPSAQAQMPGFKELYVCDPSKEYWGFKSWDNYFTRLFRPGVRPVAFPQNDWIVNAACQSTVYRIAYKVKSRDSFWLKGQCYSLNHIINNHEFAPQFAGGTVFQAFLDAKSYHRWHCPVNGTVVKTELVPGTYYAESPLEGFSNPDGPDPAAPNRSQGFIAMIATRALIFIESDNPDIGLMCFVGVGMVEVSTCDIRVQEGQRVAKGDELGMFHFGGSTHCLIFRPQTKITFLSDYPVGAEVPLNAPLAVIDGILDHIPRVPS
jgi:phosphatidylserine decarboxylase